MTTIYRLTPTHLQDRDQQRITARDYARSVRQEETSRLETSFAHLMATEAPGLFMAMQAQFRYVPGRRFTADYAFPDARLLIEIEGGVWSAKRSGHSTGSGIQRDCLRANLAAIHGFRVMRFTVVDLRDEPQRVVEDVRAALAGTTATATADGKDNQ